MALYKFRIIIIIIIYAMQLLSLVIVCNFRALSLCCLHFVCFFQESL